MSRLDTQRPASKMQARRSSRYYVRGYDAVPAQPWGDSAGSKGAAKPYSSFAPEPTVTASDSTNAARLGPLGYVANPTSNWTVGQSISVGGFLFNWNGTAWAAGAHA